MRFFLIAAVLFLIIFTLPAYSQTVQIYNQTMFCWSNGNCYTLAGDDEYVNTSMITMNNTLIRFYSAVTPNGRAKSIIDVLTDFIISICSNTYCPLDAALKNISIDFYEDLDKLFPVSILVLHNSSSYGKDEKDKYAYFIEKNKIFSLILDTGKLASLEAEMSNISIVFDYRGKTFIVYTPLSKGMEKFIKRVGMIRNSEFLNYGKFTFGYDLSKKFLVRIISKYSNVILAPSLTLTPGEYTILISKLKLSIPPLIGITVK